MKNVTSFILIIIGIGLFFVYIRPEYGTISLLRAEKSDYENTLAKSKDLKVMRDDFLAKYNAITDADKAKLQSMVPATFDSVKLVADMNAIAAKYGMTIRQVTVSDQNSTMSQSRSDIVTTVANVPYKTAIISFTTSGQYSNFTSFLKDLESNVELVDITQLKIGPSRQSVGALDLQVVLNTYYIN